MELTLHNNILTSHLVPLTPATDLGEAIALMVEGLTALTYLDLLCQLALGAKDQ